MAESVSDARFGAVVATGDLNADGFADVVVSSPGSGQVLIYRGSDVGLARHDHREGDVGSGTGLAVGDFDGDGRDDVAIGNPLTGRSAGSVTIVYGNRSTITFDAATRGVPGAPEAGDEFGATVAAGDLDGDGIDDLVVGIPGEALGAKHDAGAAVLIRGSRSGLNISSGARWLSGDSPGVPGGGEAGDRFAGALAIGDFDGDGAEDLAVGAPGEALGSTQHAGAVIVFSGFSPNFEFSQARWLSGASAGVPGAGEAGDRFGTALAAGDLSGDGYAELVVGIPSEAIGAKIEAGAAILFPGSPSGVQTTGSIWISGDSAGAPGISEPGDRFGSAFAIGDYDGDGTVDLAVGIPGEALGSTTRAGAILAFRNTGSGVGRSGAQWISGRSLSIPGWGEKNDEFGSSLALVAIDGEAAALVVGVPGETLGPRSSQGALIVLPPRR